MELLLYTHVMNCALLKETVMDLVVENEVQVLLKVPLNDVPEALNT